MDYQASPTSENRDPSNPTTSSKTPSVLLTMSRARATIDQLDTLLEFMEQNGDFAKGKLVGVYGAKLGKSLWLRITRRLNKLGTTKKVGQWQKTWSDMKRNARTRHAEFLTALESSEHAGQTLLPCYYDERVISIIGQETSSPQSLLAHAEEDDQPMDISQGIDLADSEINSDDDAGMSYTKQSPVHRSTPYSKRIRQGKSSVVASGSKRRVKPPTLLSDMTNLLNQRNGIEKSHVVGMETNSAILKASENYNETLKKVVENTLNLDKSIHDVAVAVKIGCEKIAEAMYDVATTGLNQISDVLLNGVGNA